MTRIILRAWVGLSLLGACSFQADADAAIDVNTCVLDADCGSEASCEQGMCIARGVPEPLSVMLQVTPVRMPDGSSALPIALERFLVEGESEQSWLLPSVVQVSGRIHEAGTPVEAEVRFTPASKLSGVVDTPVVASTLGGDASAESDYAVRLLDGVDYEMQIVPIGGDLPPVRMRVSAQADARVDVDYDALALEERTFRVRGGPEGQTLLVRAFDRETGEALSSTSSVVDGEARVRFAPGGSAYRLELSVDQSYAEAVAQRTSSSGCDQGAPAYPTFSIDDDAIESGSDGVGVIELPDSPARISYEGSVDLCAEAPGGASADSLAGSLPIDLRSTALSLAGETAFHASFVATTSASLDRGERNFCIEVFEGSYEVVVTPPAGVDCAIFAETRIVETPDGVAQTGVLFELPQSAYLSGSLRAPDGTPVGGAAIEVHALGRSEGLELAEDDLSVTRYNRSKQTTSDESGAFRVGVDLGSYDVLAKPPAGSGYPWRVLHDVAIGAREVDFGNIIEVGSPVPIEGELRYAGGDAGANATLEGAELKAFAVIDDETDGERAVPIGKTTVDADGRFVLLLSPSTRSGW